jgi:hypothetical protein
MKKAINYKAVADAIEQVHALYVDFYPCLSWEDRRVCEQALARARGCIAHLKAVESACK